MRYFRRLRISRARELIQHTDLRIRDIADQVGFRDPLHFSRVFRKETGRSPRAERAARPEQLS